MRRLQKLVADIAAYFGIATEPQQGKTSASPENGSAWLAVALLLPPALALAFGLRELLALGDSGTDSLLTVGIFLASGVIWGAVLRIFRHTVRSTRDADLEE